MAEEMPLMGSASSSRTMNRPIAAVAALCAVFLAGVAIADLSSQGKHASVLGQMNLARNTMLYDAALEPLYTSGDENEVIMPYSWAGVHAAQYDPEAQNAFADLPMVVRSSALCLTRVDRLFLSWHAGCVREDIVDPDDAFRGEAIKDMSKSCDKTFSCPEIVNVFDYMPETEALSMSTKGPHARSMSTKGPHVPEGDVLGDITLAY
ncbi:hypothetical protein T484DRAFT_1881485 [Baffinella frigidus]|nr:hypothetical protein T484DRAFT_1881485 [Cryptophyta sp. CCMP2293]